MWFDVFMIACGLVVVVGVCGLLVDRYWLVVDWWPLVGWEWRAERHDRKQLERSQRELHQVLREGIEQAQRGETVEREDYSQYADDPDEPDWGDHWDESRDWADELHAINQELHSLPGPADGDPGNPPRSLVGGRAGEFGDLTRPVHELTHYEVEAVIRQLGHADWLPQRLAA